MMETLSQRYRRLLDTPTDISEHLPVLRQLAFQCDTVMEIGVRYGTSSTALLVAQPDVLTLIDIHPCESAVKELMRLAGRTKVEFIQSDSRKVPPRPVDMLHIDGEHTYECLREELHLHGSQALKFIAIHDTELFPEIFPAVQEFISEMPFRIHVHRKNNNGMTILERIRS